MYEHFTDAENTGAPLVPKIATSADPESSPDPEDHEEVVLSHRIEP